MLTAFPRADGLLTLVGRSKSGCRAWRKLFDATTLRVVKRPKLTL